MRQMIVRAERQVLKEIALLGGRAPTRRGSRSCTELLRFMQCLPLRLYWYVGMRFVLMSLHAVGLL